MASLTMAINAHGAIKTLREFDHKVDGTRDIVSRFAGQIRADFATIERAVGLVVAPLKVLMGITIAAKTTMLALGAASIKAAANYETFRQQLRTVIATKKDADEAFSESIEFSVRTPFTPEEIISTRIALEGVGVKGAAAVQSVAEAAGALNRNILEVASAVKSMETEPLRNLGIIMAQESGRFVFNFQNAIGQMVKLAVEGRQKAQQALLGIFETKFGGGIERMSLTYSGLVSTLQGAVQALRAEFGAGILDQVKLTIKDLIDGSEALMGNARKAGEFLGQKLADARVELLAGFDVALKVAEQIGKAMSQPGGVGTVILQAMKLGVQLLAEGIYLAFKSSIALWKTIGTILGQGVLDAIYRSGLPLAGMARERAVQKNLQEKPLADLQELALAMRMAGTFSGPTSVKETKNPQDIYGGFRSYDVEERPMTAAELAEALAQAIGKLPVEQQLAYAQFDPSATIEKSIAQSQSVIAESLTELGAAALGSLQEAINEIAEQAGLEPIDIRQALEEARAKYTDKSMQQLIAWENVLEGYKGDFVAALTENVLWPMEEMRQQMQQIKAPPTAGPEYQEPVNFGLLPAEGKATNMEGYLLSLTKEAELLSLSNEERARAQVLIKAQEAAQKDFADGLRQTVLLTGEETEAIEQQVRSLQQVKESKFTEELEKEVAAMRALNQAHLKGHDAYERTILLQQLMNRAQAQGIPITEDLVEQLREYIKAMEQLRIDRETGGGGPLEGLIGGFQDLGGQLDTIAEKCYDVGQSLRDGLASALADALLEAEDFGDAMEEILRSIAREMLEYALKMIMIKTMTMVVGGAASRGGVVEGGEITGFRRGGLVGPQGHEGASELAVIRQFQSGGLVTRPTYFPMTHGRKGLMGEAGPEAIVPAVKGGDGGYAVRVYGSDETKTANLVRGSDGRLGIEAFARGGVVEDDLSSLGRFATGGVVESEPDAEPAFSGRPPESPRPASEPTINTETLDVLKEIASAVKAEKPVSIFNVAPESPEAYMNSRRGERRIVNLMVAHKQELR